MKDEDILEVVKKYMEEWKDHQIGAFVYYALTEDMTAEDIMSELNIMEVER